MHDADMSGFRQYVRRKAGIMSEPMKCSECGEEAVATLRRDFDQKDTHVCRECASRLLREPYWQLIGVTKPLEDSVADIVQNEPTRVYTVLLRAGVA